MINISITSAKKYDNDWIFNLYRKTMKDHIENTWGWDEQFQRNGFSVNILLSDFKIIKFESKSIGGYCLVNMQDHMELKMLLIYPEYQKQGFGTKILDIIKNIANFYSVPIKLKVMQTNPAKLFYVKNGFVESETLDGVCNLMWWNKRKK